MLNGNSWDLWLWAGAAYIAVISLVRLMLAARDRLGQDVQRQIHQERERQAEEKRAAEKERRRHEREDERSRPAA